MTNQDLYGDDDGSGMNSAQDPAPNTAGDGGAGDEEQGQTFLVDKSLLPPDVKPGDQWPMEVVRVHDQEAECRIGKAQEEPEQPGEGEESGQQSETAPAGHGADYE